MKSYFKSLRNSIFLFFPYDVMLMLDTLGTFRLQYIFETGNTLWQWTSNFIKNVRKRI